MYWDFWCLKATHQSAPLSIVSEQAAPRAAKSADKMEGAMMAGGLMAADPRLILTDGACYQWSIEIFWVAFSKDKLRVCYSRVHLCADGLCMVLPPNDRWLPQSSDAPPNPFGLASDFSGSLKI